jgi:toxin ParE1/3/4
MRNSKFLISISDDSELDILEGYLWYEEQKTGLGDQFLNALEESFKKITGNPDYYHFVQTDTRVYSIKKYPFNIVYFLEINMIKVIAVFHTSRNPSDWQERKADL